jgi:hypothetical protein
MKFPMRVFGEIKGLDQEKIRIFQEKHISPFELGGDFLEVEYEGSYIDIEEILNDIVHHLDQDAHGHVDCIDHENWEVFRYTINKGILSCKKVNPDNALEAYKW